MKKRSYYEQLKDPRWQKRRLEILNEAGFNCQGCGDGESTLHVHHLVYHKGKAPWEYEDKHLICLCEACHESWHDAKSALDEVICGLDAPSILRVAGYAFAVSGQCAGYLTKGIQRCQIPDDSWVADGIRDALGQDLDGAIDDGWFCKKKIWQEYIRRLTGDKLS